MGDGKIEMRTYCTLFDHTYLSRGLALYDSLFRYEKDAVLYILAMDNICYLKLKELNLEYARIICETEFENDELKKLKRERGRAEYCWTCTSFLIEYIFDNYEVSMCTYLDADIYFFHSPDKIFEEMQGASVLITPHNYAEYCDLSRESGRYCVQFLPFVNDEKGRAVLKNWKENCADCCEISLEKGCCGDQKYLDDWMEHFDGIYETKSLGIGVAPWNAARFSVYQKYGQLYIFEKRIKQEDLLIFYHFHGLKFFDKDIVRTAPQMYDFDKDVLCEIYSVYINEIEKVHFKYHLETEINYDGAEHYRSLETEALSKNYYRKSWLVAMCEKNERMGLEG